jgi:hypothetical protein
MVKQTVTRRQRQFIFALVLAYLVTFFNWYNAVSVEQVSIQGQVWERRSCADGYVAATDKTVKLFELDEEVGITSTSGNGFFAFRNVAGNKTYKLQVLHGPQPSVHISVPLHDVVEATFFISLVSCDKIFLPLVTNI